MSTDPRASSQSEEQGVLFASNTGQQSQMKRTQEGPDAPPLLPPPSQIMGPGRILPPLPTLTTGTRSPGTPGQIPVGRMFQGAQSPPQSQQGFSAPVPTFPHPALYPQRASYQSKNPGTVYEALSPVEYGHGLFNQAGYPPNPHPPGPVSTFTNPTAGGAGPQSRPSSTASSSGAGSIEGSARSSLYQPSPQAALHLSSLSSPPSLQHQPSKM